MSTSMKSIYKLLTLDYYVLKALFGFVAGAIIIATIIGCVTQPSMLIMVILTFSAFLLSVLFSVAEKSNFNKLYGSLPIVKSEIILGRYLFATLTIFMLSIIAFLLFCISSILLEGNIEWFNGTAYWVGAFIITTLFISIQFPIYFRFEYSKAMFIAILPYILVFTIGFPLFGQLMKQSTFSTMVLDIVSYFQSHIYFMVFMGIGVGLAFLSLSCLASIILAKRRHISY